MNLLNAQFGISIFLGRPAFTLLMYYYFDFYRKGRTPNKNLYRQTPSENKSLYLVFWWFYLISGAR